MIKVKTKAGDVILINNNIHKTFEEIFTIPGLEKGFKYFGDLSQLDKELEEFVHKMLQNNPPDQEIKFRGQYYDYCELTSYLDSPKQSFISLIKSQHPEFDSEKEYLLIKLL